MHMVFARAVRRRAPAQSWMTPPSGVAAHGAQCGIPRSTDPRVHSVWLGGKWGLGRVHSHDIFGRRPGPGPGAGPAGVGKPKTGLPFLVPLWGSRAQFCRLWCIFRWFRNIFGACPLWRHPGLLVPGVTPMPLRSGT
eukprot:gene16416-biopygen11300